MAQRKIINAASVALWFCQDDRLHIEMRDHNGQPVAAIQLDLEDGIEIVSDLAAELGLDLVDPEEHDDFDSIGPTVGNA